MLKFYIVIDVLYYNEIDLFNCVENFFLFYLFMVYNGGRNLIVVYWVKKFLNRYKMI